MISSIRLQNFRSYRDSAFEFEPGVNIVVGPNAAGKTNLIEAVMVLAQGSSYKAKDVDLVRFSAPWARVDGNFSGAQRALKLEGAEDGIIKSYVINDKPYKRLNLNLTQPVVFFEPNHLQLISRGPDQRREYIDDLLARSRPGFKALAAAYRRTLAQRNALLKKGAGAARPQLFAWDVRLGELGSQVAAAREDLVNQLNKKISRVYSRIAGKRSKVTVNYAAQFALDSYASRMVAGLAKNVSEDLRRGFTSAGPHREDIVFHLNAKPVALAASRGESRSLLLALKSLELGILEEAHGQKPVLLLDDVFSELDGSRRQALVELLSGHQAILTTTDADAVLGYFTQQTHILPLK